MAANSNSKWVDKLVAVRSRKWTPIYKGPKEKALRAIPVIYAARRRRGFNVLLRRTGGLIEARKA